MVKGRIRRRGGGRSRVGSLSQIKRRKEEEEEEVLLEERKERKELDFPYHGQV